MSLEIALEKIRKEAKEKTGFLDIGNLGLVKIPDKLFDLTHLKCLVLDRSATNWVFRIDPNSKLLDFSRDEIPNPNHFPAGDERLSKLISLETFISFFGRFSDLTPLAKLPVLRDIRCPLTQVRDLSSLSELKSLATFDCSGTKVSDLNPLSGLQSLASLDCSGTKVSDLTPLSGLQSLADLDCSRTEVSDLTPLSGLQSLATLNCSDTLVRELPPLRELHSLVTLECNSTRITDLDPLIGLETLVTLNFAFNEITDLTPLSGLKSLVTFDCSFSPLTDLSSLYGLKCLATLGCNYTEVTNLEGILKGDSISRIDVWDCPISELGDHKTLNKLGRLVIGGEKVRLTKIPPEVLSQQLHDDCLERLEDHFEDLGENPASFDEVKVFLLGNGRIGKTQIARQLRKQGYDPSELSTHGVNIDSADFPMRAGVEAKLNIWDFGGQDIYHGTHALFLKTRAIFVVVWTPDSEQGESKDPDGTPYSNKSLSYWIDYVEKLGGGRSPLIILQNQCDEGKAGKTEDEIELSPSCRNFLKQVGVPEAERRQITFCGVSAKDRSHWDKFEGALKDSVNALWDYSHPQIGRSRLKLWDELNELRSEGVTKRLSWEDYLEKVEHHGITGAEGFAEILHHAGMVFWKKELFGGDLILRQDWCLDAIYTVMTRQAVLQKVRAQNGIFTRHDLDVWVWREAGYKTEEQEEFLQMMVSCGICFPVGGYVESEEYIAPELLIPPNENEVVKLWDLIHGKVEEVEFRLSFLAPGTSRAVLAELGRHAGRNAAYWKYGLFFWGECGTAVKVAEVADSKSHTGGGSIILQTKGTADSPLRSHIASLISEVLERLSPKPTVRETSKWDRKEFEEYSTRSFIALPPKTELEWSSERVLHAMRPGKRKNVYVLGSLDRRITFHSQQVRALRLIRALAEEGGMKGKSIAVIGGGVAGITTAVAAAKVGCAEVDVFEERSQILQLQARANHRYIHPHIYQWPAEGSDNPDAGLPLMNWQAGNADKVVMDLHNGLVASGLVKETEDSPRMIRILKETTIESFHERHDKVELYAKNCFCPDEYDLVILTCGFGLEAEKPLDAPCHSYWRPDNLEGPFSSKNPERILVSGIGDGGLIDLMRAAIHTGDTSYGPHTFQHSEAVKKLCTTQEFQLLGERLKEVDQRYRMSEQSKAASYDLRKHYHAVFRDCEDKEKMKAALMGMKRTDTEVWFNYGRAEDVFNLNSALLNRVLVFLLIECGIIHPLRGRIKKCIEEQDLYAVKMEGRDAFESQRFNRVILRFGPDKDYLAKRFPELEGCTGELRDKGLLFPITRLDRATREFFENL